MMTKPKSKSKSISQVLSNSIDDLYYSCSLEFWLSIATVGIAADWIFKFGTESLLITLAWAGVLGTYIFSTSRLANRLWYDLRNLQAPRHLGLWLAGLGVLATLFFVNAMTDPAHGLIVTASGTTAIKGMLSGNAFGTATASTTTTAAAASGGSGVVTGGTGTAGLSVFADTVITLIKVIFALSFIFALYGAYQKYQERAELQEIVQSPVILIIVVLAIDGMLQVILGAT
jgi:hypothetical protein